MFAFASDQATDDLLKVTAWCLATYFGCEDAKAASLINEYHQQVVQPFTSEDHYHHLGPHEIAVRIYYTLVLRRSMDQYIEWRTSHGFNKPPLEYFRYYRDTRGI